jgi:hypothetical protein
MALIVGYRKSGLSLNHIIGCPLLRGAEDSDESGGWRH